MENDRWNPGGGRGLPVRVPLKLSVRKESISEDSWQSASVMEQKSSWMSCCSNTSELDHPNAVVISFVPMAQSSERTSDAKSFRRAEVILAVESCLIIKFLKAGIWNKVCNKELR
jgi:hypothetical protein